MNKFIMLAGSSLLLLGTPAFGQDSATPPSGGADLPSTTVPTDAAPDAGIEAGVEAGVGAGATTSAVEEAWTEEPTAEAGPAVEAAVEPATPGAFTDAQVTGFVEAMTAIQALPGDDASKQTQALEIVTNAGIDVATYNAIGEAMQTDPALADRVRVALAATQTAPGV